MNSFKFNFSGFPTKNEVEKIIELEHIKIADTMLGSIKQFLQEFSKDIMTGLTYTTYGNAKLKQEIFNKYLLSGFSDLYVVESQHFILPQNLSHKEFPENKNVKNVGDGLRLIFKFK